jgi:ribonuclease HII
MQELHAKHPHYGWNENKGYGTLKHRKGIVEHGCSPYHRKTFSMGTAQLSLPLAADCTIENGPL